MSRSQSPAPPSSHAVGVTTETVRALEKVSPEFVQEGLLRAREKSWKVLKEISAVLREGMTEPEARELGRKIFADHGVKKHWHQVYVRFGPGTLLTFHQPLQLEYRLQPGDPVFLDLGPVWSDPDFPLEYEGDVGESFVFGANLEAKRCSEAVREIFKTARDSWQSGNLSGEDLYRHMKESTEKRGYQFIENVEGHRLSDFPHQQHARGKLSAVPFRPGPYFWVLELQIRHPTLPIGAFHEDLLY